MHDLTTNIEIEELKEEFYDNNLNFDLDLTNKELFAEEHEGIENIYYNLIKIEITDYVETYLNNNLINKENLIDELCHDIILINSYKSWRAELKTIIRDLLKQKFMF